MRISDWSSDVCSSDLPGRRVLVSPEAVERIDGSEEKVAVGLSKPDLQESPSVEADAPVSRQNEIALADHFSWPRYWENFPAEAAMMPVLPKLPHQDQKRVVKGKREAVRVVTGASPPIKKK